MDGFNLLKEEFKVFGQFFVAISNQVNGLDEIEMAKTRMRLRNSHEPYDPNQNHVVDADNIKTELYRHSATRETIQAELRRKYGSLAYLKNLMKVKLNFNHAKKIKIFVKKNFFNFIKFL